METTANSVTANQISSRLLKNSVCKLLKKISEARRAKDRRAEAYLGSTLERVD
jgi:hypothetical protein